LARYLDIAIKSANETEYHLRTASDGRALASHETDPLGAEAVEVRRMLYGLRKRVLASVHAGGAMT
jgi:four helix bundle protein